MKLNTKALRSHTRNPPKNLTKTHAHHARRQGRKSCSLSITHTVLWQYRYCSWLLPVLLSPLAILFGGVREEDASCPGTTLLSCYTVLSAAAGRLSFQSFSVFLLYKMCFDSGRFFPFLPGEC